MIPWLVLLQATLTIATGPASGPEYWPLWVAQSEGYFTQEKLAVNLAPARADTAAADALAHHRVDLAATSLDAAITLGHAGGTPPKLVFGLTATPAAALLVPTSQKEPVRTLSDLGGKTIGISAPGTPAALILLSVLEYAGVPLPKVTVKSYGERGLASAIASGEVAAGIVEEPAATRLVEEGQATVLVDLRKKDADAKWVGVATVFSAVFAAADTKLGPAQLTPFCRALLRALARLDSATPEELRAALPPEARGFLEDFAARLAGARETYLRDGWVSPEMLSASVTLVRNRTAIPVKVSIPRVDRMLLTDPLRAAIESPRRD
jgi:NitT/TauT family transport system substrate-binding protein